ncbi:MAG: ImmA/IrrE family metallo-endopeptidase [Candidatus Obscuribacterales bacterium]|jgi:Zn-dependent peptidase ImmA (M78 family)
MPEQIPINATLLTWARERAGWTLSDAKAKYHKFAEWENGSSFPTYIQLESLADDLKIPVAVFFFPVPPALPPITETFRTLPSSEVAKLPKGLRMLLRQGKAMQLNLMEMTGGVNPSPKLITRDLQLDANEGVTDMAQRVRLHLGVSLDEQRSWRSTDEALKKWRDSFLSSGIYIFKEAFRLEQYFGFCLYDDLFPIIYLNNSSSKTRQIFTCFHELAHLLFHTSGIDFFEDEYLSFLRSSDQAIEVACNRFAAEFLLPDFELTKMLQSRQPSETTAEIIAQEFNVSREVVFRRFLDKGLISEKTYQEAAMRWNDQRTSATKASESSGNYYNTKLAYLGREYVSLALRQYHQNKIDEEKLALFLVTKPKNVPTLEEYFLKGGQ